MTDIFSHSEKRWISSFLVVDGLFWLLMAGTCLFSYEDCAPTLAFGPTGFFAPFWFWMTKSSVNFDPVTGTILLAGSGMLGHALIGWLLGRILSKPVPWYISVPLVGMAVMVISYLGMRLGVAIGIYK